MQKVKQKIIAFSGPARVGKDSFTRQMIIDIGREFPNLRCKQFSFAEGVRQELEEFVQEKYGISVWTEDPKEKELIRPLLIAHGNIRRNMTNNQYWIDYLCKKLNTMSDIDVCIVSDLRFASEEKDESFWVKENKGLHIHLKRKAIDGKPIKPNNEFEKKNEPLLAKAASEVISIASFEEESKMNSEISKKCKEILDKYIGFFL
jgi:hypothetical protein